MNLNEEERKQLKKIIESTGVIPPGLQDEAIVRKFQESKEGPVSIVLQDENNDKKNFELISVRKKNGLLGHELEIPLSSIINLGRRSGFTPWITKVVDDKEQIFPYYRGDSSKILFSPIFFLIKNKAANRNKLGPYNVPIAGFLFIHNPKMQKNFLEAVSGSVAANVAVIENLMTKAGEKYTRKNHILNWIAFLLSKDSKNIVVQAFSMHDSFTQKHREYVNSLSKK